MPSSSSSIPMSSSYLGPVKIKDVTNKKPIADFEGSKPHTVPSTKAKKHVEEISSYMPKALDFNTPGSLTQETMGSTFHPSFTTFQQGSLIQNHQGSFRPPGCSIFLGSFSQPGCSMSHPQFSTNGVSVRRVTYQDLKPLVTVNIDSIV
ncbi:hypothetical protein QVD17_30346 [Tagetes erecta]|uniref:Uncharacterized protein n=1 Tax=Tagetes erecta TaxID=13708 RepID=A0AAD8K2I7_TARER|nr:hypothetical protein QVD17_30346 [Tagetes erecta]